MKDRTSQQKHAEEKESFHLAALFPKKINIAQTRRSHKIHFTILHICFSLFWNNENFEMYKTSTKWKAVLFRKRRPNVTGYKRES